MARNEGGGGARDEPMRVKWRKDTKRPPCRQLWRSTVGFTLKSGEQPTGFHPATQRLRPCSLARYKAMSARLSKSSTVVVSSVNEAQPMLTVNCRDVPT